jgi:cystathionine gamma-synthase
VKPRQPISCEHEPPVPANQVPSPADPRRVLEDEIALRSMLILSNHTPVGEFFYQTSSWIRCRANVQSKKGDHHMTHRISTQSVHAGEAKKKPFGAITTPIVQASTYTFQDTAEIMDFMHSKEEGKQPLRDEYGRYSNPTQSAAEAKLAALEGGEEALLFASGMGALTSTLLSLLSAGDHLIMTTGSYHRTLDFARSYLPRWGITVTYVAIDGPQALAEAIRPNTRLVLSETPTNPYLRVIDLASLVAIAQRNALITVLDSTFATPVNLRPLEYGVDLVIQSATKYLGGHNDLLAGAVIGSRQALSDIRATRGVLGGISNPQEAYLLLRGLKTLEIRVLRQNETGLRVAQYLEDHPKIARVYYPGLPSHPDHEVARRQMSGFGGVVSFEIDGDFDRTSHFIDLLHLPYIGPTLGGVESVIQQPAALYSLDALERKADGIKDNLVRYAIGIENVEDILEDLEQALAKL